ncbi:MAG: hypothetical protein ACXQS6_05140 [Candidatus Syntropharchaeales archaeon]
MKDDQLHLYFTDLPLYQLKLEEFTGEVILLRYTVCVLIERTGQRVYFIFNSPLIKRRAYNT